MGFSNLGGCSSIRTYEQAQAHWDRTPAPRAKRRGSSVWSDNQRPLDDVRKWHYRVERGHNADYYDICLYHTCMLRLHKPLPDGSRCVEYTNHGSNLSKQFMWRMGFGPALKFGDVVVPVAYKELGTTIWTDANGRLLKDKSHHAPVYRHVTSPEQKAWRKTLKESTRNLVTLFEMGMQVPEPGVGKWGLHAGAPFKGVDIDWGTKQTLRYFDGELHEGTTHLQIEALKHVWDACLQFLIDKRDYGTRNTQYRYGSYKEGKPYKAPTPQEVTRSWYTQIEKLCCSERAADERIPDWPTSLPAKYHF